MPPLPGWRQTASDYLKIASGSVGRLLIALVYFLIAANVLSLADFGLFAASSAVGVVLSRVAGFGFLSPVFRAATVRRRLTGTYLAGFFALFAASLPVVALIAWAIHGLLLGEMAWLAFACILIGEVIGWRLLEVVAIVNNGLRRFGRAAAVVLMGSVLRTLAALAFWLSGASTLETWALSYTAANLLAMVAAWIWFMPRLRLRWRPGLYRGRARDALASGGADLIFYIQAELDKAVVLAAAGPQMAGLYAIAMRVIDLTAAPIRVFNQLAMQDIMTSRNVAGGRWRMLLKEAAIALISTLALGAVIVLLWLKPDLLGRNVAVAAGLFPLMILVPAFRNLIEHHAEVLYGMERAGLRALLLALIAGLKALMIWQSIAILGAEGPWPAALNGAFLLLYALSLLTVTAAIKAVRRPL
jgi:O-antigen/teichoic acid export membrane protein